MSEVQWPRHDMTATEVQAWFDHNFADWLESLAPEQRERAVAIVVEHLQAARDQRILERHYRLRGDVWVGEQ
jgi:hypothetical protein